jgi:hypothetical protein
MRPRRVFEGSVVILALIEGAALGTAVGSASGPFDDWGCSEDRIGTELYTLAETGGYTTPDEAAVAHVSYLAADGQLDRSAYTTALTSNVGGSRYEPGSGKVYIDDQVEAQLALVRLSDGTWAVSRMTICTRGLPPGDVSPYPTPASSGD